MRRLVILRHAKSSWADPGQRDRDRPLTPRGERDAPRMGRWLLDLGPDLIVASPAVRARTTAQLVAGECGVQAQSIRFDPRIYEARLDDLLAVLGDTPAAACTILVGHNPGLEDLLDHLSATPVVPVAGKLLATCTAAVLELPDDWSQLGRGCGQLAHCQRPRDLP